MTPPKKKPPEKSFWIIKHYKICLVVYYYYKAIDTEMSKNNFKKTITTTNVKNLTDVEVIC